MCKQKTSLPFSDWSRLDFLCHGYRFAEIFARSAWIFNARRRTLFFATVFAYVHRVSDRSQFLRLFDKQGLRDNHSCAQNFHCCRLVSLMFYTLN